MHVLARQRIEQPGVQQSAEAAPGRRGVEVDGGLDGRVIRPLLAERPTPGVPEDLASLLDDEESMSGSGGVIDVPPAPLLRLPHLDVEGDRGVDDVVVVDRRQAREVARLGGSNPEIGHAGCSWWRASHYRCRLTRYTRTVSNFLASGIVPAFSQVNSRTSSTAARAAKGRLA